MTPIEKIRSIVDWANNQSEYINEQFKSIQAIEQAYDYCNNNDFPFIDEDYIYSGNLDEKEQKAILKQRKKWLNNHTHHA